MYICKYCLRNLKNKYETCPGCGASQFEEVLDYREKVIKDPPQGGYRINLDSYYHEIKKAKIFKFIGYFFAILTVFLILYSIGYNFDKGIMLITLTMDAFYLGMAVFFIKIGSSQEKDIKQDIKKAEKLSKTGMLIKNLDYEILYIGVQANVTKPVYQIKVVYVNQTGVKVPFISNAKYDSIPTSSTGTADLLVDPNDFSNYYIDFEIF